MGEQTEGAHNYFKKVRGSDPRLATCRGKLQSQRSKLNQEINKQTMMRNGAEKLYRVTTNRKLRETVALELSFINSNLQLLKEQLADLNSSVSIYQNNSTPQLVPMIPLGLKETKEIDFGDIFKDFILEHYSEDGGHYEDAIKEFMDIRQAVRTPTRDPNGVKLLFGYYNLLYFVDRRFFPPHRNMGVFFEWFDSLTGVPSTQKTIAFEKASVLFNIAALYTQIAARQDRVSSSGVEAAVDNFLRAAGMFRYIRDNFSNAPSMDLSPHTLDTLIQLMLAQARECLFEKLIPGVEKLGLQACLEVAQEAEEVSAVYSIVHRVMAGSPAKDYVPFSWISLLLVKAEHYRALAHHYAAVGLLQHTGEINEETAACLEFVHNTDANNSATCMDIKVPRTAEERRQLGQAHLRESLLLHEESLRLHRMCRQLRQIDHLQDRLRAAHDASLDLYDTCEHEDDFQDLLHPPPIQAATKYQLTLMPPDFSEHAIVDPFHDLGPLKVFNARRQWTAPRTVLLQKGEGGNFGFSVRGDAPVLVAALEPDSTAKEAGLRESDFIVCIGEVDTKWMGHEEVVRLIRESGDSLSLKVVTPTDPDHTQLLRPSPSATMTVKPRPTTLTSPFAKDKRRRATWNFFRRSRDSDFPVLGKKDDNVLFR